MARKDDRNSRVSNQIRISKIILPVACFLDFRPDKIRHQDSVEIYNVDHHWKKMVKKLGQKIGGTATHTGKISKEDHNSPIYNECHTQQAKVLALP